MRTMNVLMMMPLMMIALLLFSAAGCNRSKPKPAGFPELVSGKITVIQDGKPLEKASVQLVPDDGKQNWGTVGLTNTNGVAVFVTASDWKGVPLGKFKVLIKKTVSEESTLVEPPLTDTEAYQKWEIAKNNERLKSFSLVDPKFGNVATSHSIEVTGAFEETFDVGTAAKTEMREE